MENNLPVARGRASTSLFTATLNIIKNYATESFFAAASQIRKINKFFPLRICFDGGTRSRPGAKVHGKRFSPK